MSGAWLAALGSRVWIGSGAMGTGLRATGGGADEPVELLNLRRPEAVVALHRAYRDAGSQFLVTNTFAANPVALEDADAADACEAVNRAGVSLARDAAGGMLRVWASVGPLDLGLRLDDYDDDALLGFYRRQCGALREADALLLETFTVLREARAALRAAAETGLPVIFQIGNMGGGDSRWERADRLLDDAHRAGVVAVGTNCLHPGDIVQMAGHLAARTALPVTAAPNAAHPQIHRGRIRYAFTDAALASMGATWRRWGRRWPRWAYRCSAAAAARHRPTSGGWRRPWPAARSDPAPPGPSSCANGRRPRCPPDRPRTRFGP